MKRMLTAVRLSRTQKGMQESQTNSSVKTVAKPPQMHSSLKIDNF